MQLTQEQIDDIERLAALNYSAEEIAMYLNVNINEFVDLFKDRESNIRFHFDRGKLVAKAKIDIQLLKNAEEGSITAMQIYNKRSAEKSIEELKKQILGGY